MDSSIDLQGVDRRITGATLHIGKIAGGAVTTIALPADGWVQTGNAPLIDFKYKSRTGPVAAVRLIDGRSVRVTVRGPAGHALDEAPQQELGVVVEVGGVRFCGVFGGTIKRDDTTRFIALEAPAPSRCPSFGRP